MINISPMARVSSKPKKADRNSQRVIHHGTNPASTKGATTKNGAEPNTAIVFGMAPCRKAVGKIEPLHHSATANM
jgi:hypothetical protein